MIRSIDTVSLSEPLEGSTFRVLSSWSSWYLAPFYRSVSVPARHVFHDADDE